MAATQIAHCYNGVHVAGTVYMLFGLLTAAGNVGQYRAPKTGTLRNLRVNARVVGAATYTSTFTLMVNGAATAIVVALNAALYGENLTDSAAVVEGVSTIGLRLVGAGAGASETDLIVTYEIG